MNTRFLKTIVVVIFLLVGLPLRATYAAPNAACVLTWTGVSSPAPAEGSYVLNAVDAGATDNVWAVGHKWRPSAFASESLAEHWNGTTWSVVTTPNVTNKYNEVKAVSVVSADDVWAVGMASENTYSQTLILHWDGTAWSIVPSPNTASGYGELYSVDGAVANDVWAVGGWNGTTLLLHWNGTAWQAITGPTNGKLKRVIAKATNDVWVLGQESATQASVLHWNGSTWSVASTIPLTYSEGPYGTHETLTDLYVSNISDMWVVGNETSSRTISYGTERHWDGTTWTLVGAEHSGASIWNAIAGTQEDNLWIIGDQNYSSSRLGQWNGHAWNVYNLAKAVGAQSYIGITALTNTEFWVVGGSAGELPSAAAIVHGTLPCKTPPAQAPDLASPSHDATVTEIHPSFSWSGVNDTEFYTIEMYKEQPSGELYADFDVSGTEFTYPLFGVGNGTYYWHVRACNYPGCSAWSDMRPLHILASAPTNAPTLIAPANGTLFIQTQIAFEWSAVPNTMRYAIEIYRGSTDRSPAYALTFMIPYPIVYDINGTGKFYWRVNACNDGGCSAWSEWGMFGKTVPKTPPVLTAPGKDAALTEPRPTFTWRSTNNATYYLLDLHKDAPKGARVDKVQTKATQWHWKKKLSEGTYYWRVRACSELSCGTWSKPRKFTIERANR